MKLQRQPSSHNDKSHPNTLNKLPVLLNCTKMDTPNKTDDWVLPDTLPAPPTAFEHTLFQQEVFTNLTGLGQVQVNWNYVRLQFEI